MYSDSRNARNLKKLYDELGDVQQIMKKNIKDLLDRGDKLNDLEKGASKVFEGTKEFKKNATWLNRMHCLRTYYPVLVVLAIIALVLFIRYKYY
jgi:vesicle transport protein SEC22